MLEDPSAIEQSTPNSRSLKVADNEVLVKVENLGKVFCRDLKRSLIYGLQDGFKDLMGFAGRRVESGGQFLLREGEFWSNQDINFELKRGECLGLIGHNGAGKTTLLKILNGLIKPDVGRVEMRGSVGALIALGAGFNPILTGRENIFIAGSVLGASTKYIQQKLEEIIEFSEIGDFIDAPVQSYSSGMQVRLGFAVASTLEPDILLIDEVLAVGDMGFRIKCLNRIHSLLPKTAVIFVSHSMQMVSRICTKGILLQKGRISAQSESITNIINNYNASFGHAGMRLSGSGGVSLQQFTINGENPISSTVVLELGDAFHLNVNLNVHIPLESIRVRIIIENAEGQAVLDILDPTLSESIFPVTAENINFSVEIPNINLVGGKYFVTIAVLEVGSRVCLARIDRAGSFLSSQTIPSGAQQFYPAKWKLCP